MRGLAPLIPFALICGVSLAPQSPACGLGTGGEHEDERFGYKIRPPKDWASIPVKVNEGWLIAKFLSDRAYYYTEKGGWTYEHKPELMVIAFVDEVVKQKGPKVEKPDEDTTIYTFQNRYKDYQDYLRNTYSGGGFYISAEEESQVGDVPVTCYEIKVEKLVRNGPKRIITWVFHVPDVDIAVQIEVLENHYKKVKSTIDRTLKSFRAIPRVGELPGEQASSGGFTFWISTSALDELSLEERTKKRREQCERQHDLAIEALPPDWEHTKEKGFLVLSNVDLKYGKRLADQASVIMDWLNKNFSYIGPDEYIREPILRVCKSRDEEYSYSRGGGGWGGTSLEFVTNKEDGGSQSFEFEWINGRVASHWFQDRDRELYWAMPEWIQRGLEQLLAHSSAKGSKLRFYPDEWSRDEMREAVREGRIISPKQLMTMSRTELWDRDGASFWSALQQSESFVYFLLAGDGSSNSKYREIIHSYLTALEISLTEMREKEKAEQAEGGSGEDEKPQTAEEEEERFRKRREQLRDQEKTLLEDVFQRTFHSWDEKDWERLEKDYLKSIS
jgi:hypothetical protein